MLILSVMADHDLNQIDDHIYQGQHKSQFKPIHPIGIVIQISKTKPEVVRKIPFHPTELDQSVAVFVRTSLTSQRTYLLNGNCSIRIVFLLQLFGTR
jgi:hypothetical protein